MSLQYGCRSTPRLISPRLLALWSPSQAKERALFKGWPKNGEVVMHCSEGGARAEGMCGTRQRPESEAGVEMAASGGRRARRAGHGRPYGIRSGPLILSVSCLLACVEMAQGAGGNLGFVLISGQGMIAARRRTALCPAGPASFGLSLETSRLGAASASRCTASPVLAMTATFLELVRPPAPSHASRARISYRPSRGVPPACECVLH